MSTPKLDQIAAKGNRGHHFPDRPESTITCADGFELSVIAGGGAYCTPRPAMCSCAWIPGSTPRQPAPSWEKECTYPGPYSEVEVMTLSGSKKKHPAKGWKRHDSGGVYSNVPVRMVRDLIESHGGER